MENYYIRFEYNGERYWSAWRARSLDSAIRAIGRQEFGLTPKKAEKEIVVISYEIRL